MKIGDLVRHKKLGWIGHIVAVQPVKAIMDEKARRVSDYRCGQIKWFFQSVCFY